MHFDNRVGGLAVALRAPAGLVVLNFMHAADAENKKALTSSGSCSMQ